MRRRFTQSTLEGHLPMLEKPYLAMAGIARKVQSVATRVALTAAKTATRLSEKARSIQLRRDARFMTRKVKAMRRRPSVQFVREYKQGRTSIAFYRCTDRSGTVSHYWSLTRETDRG